MAELMHDLILIGGGLANGLIAWRLKALQPGLRILLVEREAALGGNHTWSFYRQDLSAEQHAWIAPLVARQWPAYEVRFPGQRRMLDSACYSITSERFHAALAQVMGADAVLNAVVTQVEPRSVRINGETLRARVVIDGRGHAPSPHLRCAWQKFVGQELLLSQPHGQDHPIIMDATVPQLDGYRFVYTLPLDSRRILVEDTYYSSQPALSMPQLRQRIADYAAGRGWRMAAVEREECGVLPIALSGNIQRFWRDKPGALPCSGMRAGLFHATTGYSLPHAVRLADEVAALAAPGPEPLDADRVYRHIRAYAIAEWRSQAFLRLLNRMLFHAGEPGERYRILERFYTLPPQLIERFYAARLTRLDQLRILAGKPPVPVLGALRAMFTFEGDTSSKPS